MTIFAIVSVLNFELSAHDGRFQTLDSSACPGRLAQIVGRLSGNPGLSPSRWRGSERTEPQRARPHRRVGQVVTTSEISLESAESLSSEEMAASPREYLLNKFSTLQIEDSEWVRVGVPNHLPVDRLLGLAALQRSLSRSPVLIRLAEQNAISPEVYINQLISRLNNESKAGKSARLEAAIFIRGEIAAGNRGLHRYFNHQFDQIVSEQMDWPKGVIGLPAQRPTVKSDREVYRDSFIAARVEADMNYLRTFMFGR